MVDETDLMILENSLKRYIDSCESNIISTIMESNSPKPDTGWYINNSGYPEFKDENTGEIAHWIVDEKGYPVLKTRT